MSVSIAKKLRIHGRVQGVWYRESMRREAERCGVCGWVRNRSDGSVEAHVEGAVEAVGQIQAWCRRGPPSAAVSRLESEDAALAHADGFEVLPTL